MKLRKARLLTLMLAGACGRAFGDINPPLPDWIQRFHIGGNAAMRLMAGQSRAQLEHNAGVMIYQAGLVFDIDITDKLSFWYDTNLIREGVARNPTEYPVQEIYVRWDRIADRA